MATIHPTHEMSETTARERTTSFAAGGSISEALCGVAVIVLAIIGLANTDWTLLPAIATVVAGAALLFAGTSAAIRTSTAGGFTEDEVEAGAVSTEFLGGAAGIVLGVLAIVGLVPSILVSVSLIVFGGALLLGSLAVARGPVSAIHPQPMNPGLYQTGHRGIFAAAGSQVLVGIAVGILGIIALVGGTDYTTTLNLVGLLVFGAGVLCTGGAVSAKLVSVLAR
jgi:hypothetical protein